MNAADPLDLVIGVGHAFRCDDGAGPAVARALAERGLPGVAHEGEGSALLDLWEGRARVVVVDAMTGGEPGSLLYLEGKTVADHEARFVRSTHDVGLPEAIAFGEAFGKLPRTLNVLGIVGSNFAIGQTMTPAVREAVRRVTHQLSTEFRRK